MVLCVKGQSREGGLYDDTVFTIVASVVYRFPPRGQRKDDSRLDFFDIGLIRIPSYIEEILWNNAL
jgi:hypothetical protein